MKRILSIMLVVVLVFSSISAGVWATNSSVKATSDNLMANYTYKDWKATNRAIINAPTESFSGDMSNAFSVTKLMWRSIYTKVSLEAGETYELKFYYKEENPSKVYLTDAANRGVLMAPTSTMNFGDEITLINNDYSNNLLTDLNYNIPSDKEGWNIVTAIISPSVTGEHTFCFTGAAGPDVNDLSLIHFSDFSLVKQVKASNVLNDTVMSGLTWNAIWNTGMRDPKTGEPDKSQSYSGNAYAMTFGRNSRYRDNYTTVTLEPNTTYDFSFRYKSGTTDELIYGIGFVDAAKVDFSTIKGDFVKNHLKDATTPLLGASDAVIGKELGGVWNLVSTTFTTGSATKYILYIYVSEVVTDQGFTTITLSDFNLVKSTGGGSGEELEPTDPNVLNDEAIKSLNWSAIWNTGMRDPKTSELDKSQSYSGNAYAMTFGRNSRYRDNYTTVTLEPNTTYDFSFRYKSGTTDERIERIGFVDESKVNMSTYKGDFVKNHLTDATTPLLGESDANIERELGGVWNLVSTTFTTGSATKYILYICVGEVVSDQSFTTMTLSDFSLVKSTGGGSGEEPEPTDPNVLNDEAIKSLNWSAIWNTGMRDPKTGELDKSQSYSGNAYAMTFGRNSRYRDNYTTVTLKPNTTYNFSFRYKSSSNGQGEVISDVGFVDASKVNFSTYKGDTVAAHLTDSTTPILGKADAVKEQLTDGTWNLVTTTFTTGDASEYVMYLNCQTKNGDAGFQILTLSDFNLVAKENETPETPAEENLLKDSKGADWTSSWGSVKGIDEGGAIKLRVAYRSGYTKVKLEPNTKYELSFNYGEVRVADIRVYNAAEITDINSQMVTHDSNGGFVKGGTTDIAPALTTTNCPATPVQGAFYKASETFTTTAATEYYIILDCTAFSTTSIILKDLKLVKAVDTGDGEGGEVVDSDNVLATSKASNWTSSWGPTVGTAQGDAISLRAAYRSGYTKVTLKPNITYHFNFNFEHVKIFDIRVYDAAEITDLNTQMVSGENGGAVSGGRNNIATDLITTDCSSPEPGKVYSAFEAFTTTSATEYYIILDFLMGDGVSNNILLKNLSLKKYYNPATDVYGVLRSGMGGSVENKGEAPYEKGKATTITATPLSGNTFDGWYDADGNKISSDAAYTFVVESEFDLTAKFSGPNMPYIDWMAENGMDGTFENGAMPGWYAVDEGTGVIATFASFNPNTFASHSGNKAMAMIARYQHSYFHFNNLSKNSDYYLSFYIYCPDLTPYDAKAEIGHRGFKVNEMYVDVGGDAIWSKNNILGDGNNGWHRVEFFFNTGNADNATLCINYYGDANIAEKAVYLDDVMFVQYMADGLDNGNFEKGKDGWMGEYAVSEESGNKVATIANGKKIHQSVVVEPHTSYTLKFRAKGELLAAVTKINKYSTDASSLISSVASVKTSGDWNEYSLNLYTGMNSAINLMFEALADGAELADINITKNEDSAGSVLEKIDFETDRFAIKNSTTNKDAYEIYEGAEFAYSGNKALHFKYNAANAKTENVFNESYLGFQVSNKRVYRLTFYYKTSNGSTIKISPDFLGTQAGKVGVKHTAKGNGWNRVDFFASSSSAIYFDPIIANIVGKTKTDFYVDDITYTIVSAAVLETDIKNVYAEPPLALLYNEGFEEPITNENWGKLPSTMKVVKGDTEFGNKYLRVNGKTFYVLPVSVEAGVQYYFSASLRGTGGYIGISVSPDGKGLFTGISGEIESFIKPVSKKWSRSGIKFSAPMSGMIYLVISCDNGYLEADNVLIYKENYALEEKPYGHDILTPYNFAVTSGKNYILNGGYTADGEVLEDGTGDESPSTGDTFPATTLILITLVAVSALLLFGRKNKKEAE